MSKLLENIVKGTSRSINRQFPWVPYDDLYQDGKEHLLYLNKKFPNAELPFLISSVKNKYRSIWRQLHSRQGIILQVDDESLNSIGDKGTTSREIEIKLDADKVQNVVNKRGTVNQIAIVHLYRLGYTPKQIAKSLSIHKNSIYRELKEIRRLL